MKKFLKWFVMIIGLFVMAGCSDGEANVADTEETIAEIEAEKEARRRERQEEADKRREKEREAIFAEREKILEEKEKEQELTEANPNKTGETKAPIEVVEVPEDGVDIDINDDIPYFSNEDIFSTKTFHENGPLDSLGRVIAADALLGVEIMPAEQRGDIGDMEPTGWNQASYANIGSSGWLYNRSHLVGHQLTGNATYENLMTGTRAFNMQMLEYENFVANYIETTENHVRYRVTPVFEGDNLVAAGCLYGSFFD